MEHIFPIFDTILTKEDKEKHFANMTISFENYSESGVPQFIREATEFPDKKPFFSGIMIDNEGYILASTFEDSNGGPVFDVFSSNGRFVNRLNISGLNASFIFDGESIYDINTCEEEMPVVVCYRVLERINPDH